MSSELETIERIYGNIGVPVLLFSTFVGFSSGIMGELCHSDKYDRNSAVTSFVNITGCTFLGVFTGFYWPIAMPLLSLGAIYNKFMYKSPKQLTNK
jgi:hypothetical protein